jgi:SAM-dependent methyltransferase
MEHAHAEYLEAKRTVDDVAIDRRIEDIFYSRLPNSPRIIDFGCGTGSMLSRLLQNGVRQGEYIGIDIDQKILDAAMELRKIEALQRGHQVTTIQNTMEVDDLHVQFVVGDALESLYDYDEVDSIVGLGFADLIKPEILCQSIQDCSHSRMQVYLPITFDGETIFIPKHEHDNQILSAFHTEIDRKGTAKAGRKLITQLQNMAGELSVGRADWIVHPSKGAKNKAEFRFLSYILTLIENNVADSHKVNEWIAYRRNQLTDGELWYIAHQYDLLFRFD